MSVFEPDPVAAALRAPDPAVDLAPPAPPGGGRVVFAGMVYNAFDAIETLLPPGWRGVRVQDVNWPGQHLGPVLSRVIYRLWYETASRVPLLFQRRYEDWVVERCRQERPHLVIVKRGTFSGTRVIERLHELGTVVVNVNNDSWQSTSRANLHPLMHDAITHYDALYATKASDVPWLQARGARRVQYLRLWYSPNMFFREPIGPAEQPQWGADVVFVGTYEAARASSLERLAAALPWLRLRVYGNLWERLRPGSPLRRFVAHRDVVGRDGRLALGAAKIGLGFLRKGNGDTHTSRTFEIPATGTCMLMEHSDEQAAILPEDDAWVAFRNDDELVTKVRWLLAHDDERHRIAATGHRLVTEGPHSLRHRLARIIWDYLSMKGTP